MSGCTCFEEVSMCRFCREEMNRDDELAELRQRIEALEVAVRQLVLEADGK